MICQTGGIYGPNDEITHYQLEQVGENNDLVITFGSEERPGAQPMLVSDLIHHLHRPYWIEKPKEGWKKREDFSLMEKAKLRPIAEVLAMLDGNAFFGTEAADGVEWYESYLPEALALYQSNGGDHGWAGETSFAKNILDKNPVPG